MLSCSLAIPIDLGASTLCGEDDKGPAVFTLLGSGDDGSRVIIDDDNVPTFLYDGEAPPFGEVEGCDAPKKVRAPMRSEAQ